MTEETPKLTYDVEKARKAQNSLGFIFAPYSGECFRCGRNIYNIKNGPTAISVEQASRGRITGCPFCHYSFVE